jgi:hypothetical protein
MSECSHREFLLSALRIASARAKLFDYEITSIGIALRDDMISNEQAVKWMKDIGAIEVIPDEISRGHGMLPLEQSEEARK